MNNATLQKSGFILLPKDRTIEEFLQDISLRIYWERESIDEDFKEECFFSDEKNKPAIVPILLSIPLSALKLNKDNLDVEIIRNDAAARRFLGIRLNEPMRGFAAAAPENIENVVVHR